MTRLKNIGHTACVVLNSSNLPNTVTDDAGNTYKVTKIIKQAFAPTSSGRGFKKFVFGDNIESIDKGAFANCKIDTLILNDKLKVIPSSAFLNSRINCLTIGASVERIETEAFLSCPLNNVTCKSKAVAIAGDNVFVQSRFKNVEWLDSITSIDSKAFVGVIFSKTPTFANLESIGAEAFAGSTFPKGINQWPEFHVSSKLRHISPDALKSSNIGRFTVDENNPYFSSPSYPILLNKNATSLVMTAPKWTSPIGAGDMFPATMVKMEPKSIQSNYGVTIPSTISEMEGAFANYTLSSLTCLSTVPPLITDSTFNGQMFAGQYGATLHVPKGCEERYRNAPGWRRFTEIIGDEEYVPTDEQGREYYMVIHGNNENGTRISVPVSSISKMETTENDDGNPAFTVTRSGSENIATTVAEVDSITWMRGFVYESAEIFELNESTLTANAQKCSVRLSSTVIDEDVQLCIRNAVFTPSVLDNCVRGLAVDVSLSNNAHELSGTADITIPITYGADEQVMAAYYNEESGMWEPVYFRYDSNKGAVVITTDHLSMFSAFVIKSDNTSRTRLENLYSECPMFFDLNYALGKIYSIVSSDNPDQESVQTWRDEYGFWQSIGLDGGYNMLSSLGFSAEALSNAVDVVGYLGTATTILDVISSDLKGDNLGVASNTLKAILGFASGQMASAVGTSAIQASMGVVAFIGVALEKLGTKVQDSKKDLFTRAYRYYYSPGGRNAVGGKSKHGSKYYRTDKDWYEYFYPAFATGSMTEQRLRAYIEQVVRRYCDRFWEDHTDVFTFCMAEKDVSGMASYLYPDDYIKQKISDAYYADLMNGQLTSVFQAIKQSLAVQSMKRYQKAMRDYVALMNTNIGVRISDSSWKEGGNRPPDRVCAHQEQRKVPADSRKSRWRGESGV